MKNLYESILDDEDDILDRMGKDIKSKMVKPLTCNISKHTLVYTNFDIPGHPNRKGFGFMIFNRSNIGWAEAKGFKGFAIYFFTFGPRFDTFKQLGNTSSNPLIPSYPLTPIERSLIEDYQYLSDLPIRKLKKKCNEYLIKLASDGELLDKMVNYSLSGRSIKIYEKEIRKILDS